MKSVSTFIYKDFFTTGKGLTSTSANHLANLAKQAYTEDEAFLNSCSFINQDLSVIGDATVTPVAYGMTEEEMKSITTKLERMAALKGFIAWVREAIAEKERYCRCVDSLHPMENWAEENGITLPVKPLPPVNESAAYKLTIAEKADYLCEEAAASAFGSFIHPGGPGYNAYKNLVERMRNPRTVSENGRDTIVRTFSASVDASAVNDEFNRIRDTWRSHEARVNKQKHAVEIADNNAEQISNDKFSTDLKAYNNEIIQIQQQYQAYLQAERERIQELRIVIPNRLMAIYDELRLMGKE